MGGEISSTGNPIGVRDNSQNCRGSVLGCNSRRQEDEYVNYQENEEQQSISERSPGLSLWLPDILSRLTVCCKRESDLAETFQSRSDALMRGRELAAQNKYDKSIHAYLSALNLPPSSYPIQCDGPADKNLETPARQSSFEDCTSVAPVSTTEPLLSHDQHLSRQRATHVAQVHREPIAADSGVYAELGQVFFAANRSEQAVEAFDRAQSTAPDDVEILYQKAVVLNCCGDYGPVFGLLHRAIELKPDFGQAYFLLAVTNRQLNRLSEAVENLQTLLSFEPCRADTMSLLADCYEQQARYGEAALYLERAIELEPNDHTARRSLENVLAQLHKSEASPLQRAPLESDWHNNSTNVREAASTEMVEVPAKDALIRVPLGFSDESIPGNAANDKASTSTRTPPESRTPFGSIESIDSFA